MAITKIQLSNITIFKDVEMEFIDGINIFMGENGVGKTHVMKMLYSACQAVRRDVSFPNKVIRVFRPDDFNIRRLVSRKGRGQTGKGVTTAHVKVFSDTSSISMSFTNATNKWDATVENEDVWEKQLADLTSTYIPAKEILSNSWNLMHASAQGNVNFDDTYLDIISAAMVDISAGRDSDTRRKYLNILQKITNGKVTLSDENFYLKPGNNAKLEFNLVAEGMRKIALLWQLIKNGTLEKGSILFWDEPEANINPRYIPALAEMLLALQRNHVQVFVATHDYFLAKYFEVKRMKDDKILYHSLYFADSKKNAVNCEVSTSFRDLEHNPIMETFLALYDEEVVKAMKK